MKLTIYLMNEEVRDFDSALNPKKVPKHVEIDQSSGLNGRFYYQDPHINDPKWLPFVRPVLSEMTDSLRTSSASGLLLLNVENRIFALTFGYGRAFLDLSKIEHRFGLKVALNRIDPKHIRSLDTKTYEDMVVSTTTQMSKSAELPNFRVDISTDILRAVTGEPIDAGFAKRLSGSSSLVVVKDINVGELGDYCSQLLLAFSEDGYKENFSWIDQLREVRDKSLIDSLNKALIDDLKKGNTDKTHLAVPETLDWEDVDSFKIAGTGGVLYDDLDLDEYLTNLKNSGGTLDINSLKSRTISVIFGAANRADPRWKLFTCLVSEQKILDKLYVLIEGSWFAISESLSEEVEGYLQTFPEPISELSPSYNDEVESKYNERIAEESPDKFLNLDGFTVRPEGAASNIEFCDVLCHNGEIIHVKRRTRSATLSHLFAQGGVSARVFREDISFRQGIRQKISETVTSEHRDRWLELIPENPIDPSQFKIVYGIVTPKKEKQRFDWVPFFSKLNLMQQAKQIRSMGFEVSVVRIESQKNI